MTEVDIYEILVAEHEGMLHAYVQGLVHDSFLADDVCQEAFVQGYRRLSTLKDKAAFPSWLRSIARNLAFAELRKRKVEVPTDPDIIQGMEDVFGALDASKDPAPWGERLSIVAQCVSLLPVTLHDCCRLHYYEGKPLKEIAIILDSSLAAVLKRLERARVAVTHCVERKLQLEEA
jgi:RNA polymerase sigma-70 factor, ECF subfamily